MPQNLTVVHIKPPSVFYFKSLTCIFVLLDFCFLVPSFSLFATLPWITHLSMFVFYIVKQHINVLVTHILTPSLHSTTTYTHMYVHKKQNPQNKNTYSHKKAPKLCTFTKSTKSNNNNKNSNKTGWLSMFDKACLVLVCVQGF